MNEMMMVIANGIWVTMMTKISAGSMGARLSHRALARGLGGVIGCEARSAAGADTSHILRRVGRWRGLSRVRPRGGGHFAPRPHGHFLYLFPTFSAAFCPFSSALSTVVRPAMAELTSSEMPVARSANSGIVT